MKPSEDKVKRKQCSLPVGCIPVPYDFSTNNVTVTGGSRASIRDGRSVIFSPFPFFTTLSLLSKAAEGHHKSLISR